MVDGGALLAKTYVGQGCRVGRQFSAENCLMFANCEAFHGEACSVFFGPYSVTHHKSSLLIAGMFSFAKRDMFELEDAVQREPVKVSF